MRDDSQKWDAPDTTPEVFNGTDVTVSQVFPRRQLLVSGVDVLKQSSLPLVGWPGDLDAESCALVLRRDRILEINGPTRLDGWDEATGNAVSDMTDGYAVFEIEGEGAIALLQQGAFVNPLEESRSVSRLLFGLPVLLYRTVEPTCYCVHVSNAQSQILRKAISVRLQNEPA